MGGVLVLLSGIRIHIPDDRQQIRSRGRIVLADNLLHGFLPLDKKLLSRLLAAIDQNSVLQILLFQVSHIHKCHSPGVE